MSEGKSCLVVGVGPGLGAAIGRRFASAGYAVALAARTPGKVDSHIGEIEAAGGTARGYACDGTDEASVVALVERVEAELGPLTVAVYNASGRVRKGVAEIGNEPQHVERARAAIDEITDEPEQIAPRVEAAFTKQRPQLGVAALHVPDRVRGHRRFSPECGG